MRRRWLNLAVLGGARGLASLLAFLAVVQTAKLLSPDELGRWALALAVHGFALHLAEWGLRTVATVDAIAVGSALRHLLRTYLTLRLALASGVLASAVGLALLTAEAEAPLMLLVIAALVPIALQLDWIALADGRSLLAAASLIIRPAAFLLLVALLPGDARAVEVALAFLAAWWLAAILSWPALLRRRPLVSSAPPSARAMLARGAPIALVTFTNQAQLSADLLLVGWIMGTAAAADYYLASQIAVAGLPFANAAGQTALARLGGLGPTPFRAWLRRDLTSLGVLALAVALLLAIAGPWLVPAAFGAEHAGAATLLWYLLPWLVLQHLTTLLQAAGAAARIELLPLRANLAMLAAALPLLGLAAWSVAPAAFAAARGGSELIRLLVLAHGLRARRLL